jgi:predicted RNA-binding protein with PUA-like domain
MISSSKKYWLFKGEPHVYGIDHLAAEPKKTGCWEGIRNYQARNFLRDQVSVNDEIFIYHSNCKQIGIVGIAKVVKAAYPDPAQFNPESPYYDPKSTAENPRWVAVNIKLIKKLDKMISLAEIKAQSALQNMVLVKQSRLSTQPVTESEWKFINEKLLSNQ